MSQRGGFARTPLDRVQVAGTLMIIQFVVTALPGLLATGMGILIVLLTGGQSGSGLGFLIPLYSLPSAVTAPTPFLARRLSRPGSRAWIGVAVLEATAIVTAFVAGLFLGYHAGLRAGLGYLTVAAFAAPILAILLSPAARRHFTQAPAAERSDQ